MDPRRIVRGYDGALYHDGEMLAEVNEFNAQITVANTDYQPAKSRLSVGITTGYSVGLTFTETVVRDALLLKKLLDHVTGDVKDLDFDFLGIIEGFESDGEYAFNACEPDGTIDIANITQGEISRRSWSWRVNKPPDLQRVLDAGAV